MDSTRALSALLTIPSTGPSAQLFRNWEEKKKNLGKSLEKVNVISFLEPFNVK